MLFVLQTDDGMAIESHLTAQARAVDPKSQLALNILSKK
jgi:hypothetical protein